MATLKKFSFMPRGGKLPCEASGTRHAMIVRLLWAHAIVLPIYALTTGLNWTHSLGEGVPVAVLAGLAGSQLLPHKVRISVATLGLVVSSAVLVHISGGLIEMHFHFFVVVGVVTLYQSWTPFLLAIAFVVVHHGVMGSFFPTDIYNHADALAHPWKWAGIHGAFILAMSAAGLAAWKFSEDAQLRAVESERRHFDEERRRLMEREEAAQQLRELDEQLRHAQKMEAVGYLAGGIAHDFNNLLGVVINYGHFVAEEMPETDDRREDVLEIIKAGEKGARLTRQLLTFSRKEVIHPEVLDLNHVVGDTINILRRTITESIELTTDLSEHLLPITADRGHLEQVLMNLVVNARDSIGASGGKIVIGTSAVTEGPAAPEGDPTGWTCLTVSDNGDGMSTETQRHIFEPFFTTKDVGEGTGLGLATVYGIVTQSGGRITVDSTPEKGTTFTMYFPAATGDVDGSSTGAAPDDAQTETRPATLMVVEDEEAMRNLTTRILTRSGYEVLAFDSPLAALPVYEERGDKIDLLVTDVVMPGMSGKHLQEQTGLPTIFMSGYTREVVAQSGPMSGEPLLQKPFTADDLLTAVSSALEKLPHRAQLEVA